ncbi:MAG: hypothetical protein H0V76_04595 [Blastocatellia bacterium]|nr:hypothetical protein [Blastocatellia bacterium]
MDTLTKLNDKPVRSYSGFIIGGLIGVVLIAIVAIYILQQPSREEQIATVLATAHQPGAPEFEELAKDIVISTGENTVESPNAFGSISMFIVGTVRNNGQRLITVLEVNAAVVDLEENVIREKRVLVVPAQQPQLGAESSVPVTLSIDGFSTKDDRANIRWSVTAIRAGS